VTGPAEEHLAAISSYLNRVISLLIESLNFEVKFFRFSSTAILSSNRISFAVLVADGCRRQEVYVQRALWDRKLG